jgi:CRISPR/Cas system-associated exonuclease Cas4 (RecB family)
MRLKLSPTSIECFLRCSFQFKLKYLDERPEEPGSDNIYSVRGDAFHKLMQLHDKYDLKRLKFYWTAIYLSFLADKRNLQKEVKYSSDIEKTGRILITNGLKLKERWKDYKIIDNEKYIKIQYQNPFLEEVYLSAKLDLILSKLIEYVVVDWKTSRQKEENIDENIQLGLYIYLINKVYGVEYKNIHGALAYPFLNDILFTQRTEEQIKNLLKKVDKVIERIVLNDFKKEPKCGWNLDDCKFCPYTMSCDGLK